VRRDQASLDNAKVDLQRYIPLAQKGIISAQQVESQRSRVDQFSATLSADQAALSRDQVQLSYTSITAPIAGVLVDRWDRHRILVITQILSALQSAALAVLALMNVITVAEVIVLQIVQGVINSFDTPARQAFVVEMVEDREDLPNAIALNSSMINASRIIGPSVGGILIATLGEGWCFGADAISYVAVILSLLMMRRTPMR